jgi:hypothetical protein
VRWEDALADIEGQFDAARSMELAAEVADRSRREVASLVLRDRLLGSVGHPVEVVTAAGAWAGVLSQVGSDWLLLTAGAGAPSGEEVLVAHAGVLWVAGLGRHTTAPSPLAQRLGLAHALRRLARDRLPVTLVLAGGTTLRCGLGRVGADFLEALDEATDIADGRTVRPRVRTVPLAAIVAVRRLV